MESEMPVADAKFVTAPDNCQTACAAAVNKHNPAAKAVRNAKIG